MDLTTLSLSQLRDLQQQIPVELKRRESQEKTEALIKLRAMAKEMGFSIEELMEKEPKVKSSAGSKVKVKYRHPENTELEWTGRGRKPKWVEDWLVSGKTIESLMV